MGAPWEVVDYGHRPRSDCFEATGRNTGNLLIGNGLVSQLKFDRLVPYRYSMAPEYIEENFDQVAIAAANFLFPGFDLSPLSSILEKIRLPAFMVGLGAQLPSSESELSNIPNGTWRLVKIVAERSRTIGVRGYFTAAQLRKHGVKDVRVTGCPSLYTTCQPSVRIRRPASGDICEGAVFNGSRNVVGHAADKQAAVRVERQLLNLAMAWRRPFVLQNEQPEMELYAGEDPANYRPALMSLSSFFGKSPDELVDFYRANGKVFFSVQQWFEWISECSFSIGTRFHGNVAALLNGVPAVVLVHDSRTLELCEFTAIPHVSVSDVEGLDIKELYERADYDLFEERYNALYRKYVEFLNENAIPHKLDWVPDLPPRGRISAA